MSFVSTVVRHFFGSRKANPAKCSHNDTCIVAELGEKDGLVGHHVTTVCRCGWRSVSFDAFPVQ